MFQKIYFVIFISIFSASFYGQTNILNAKTVEQIGRKNENQLVADNDGPIPYGYVDDRDIMWSKVVWEFVDLNQKVNLPYYFPIDTTNIQGKLMFNIFASLAEFEKDLIRERTMAGLRSARVRGRMGGRPKGLSQEAIRKACTAEALYTQKELSINEITEQLSISKTTLYKYLRYRDVAISSSAE